MPFITYGGIASNRVRTIGPWTPATTHQTAPARLTAATATAASTEMGCSQVKLRSPSSARSPSMPMPAPMVSAPNPISR
jgi:hypothetical protein